eukprot:GHVQ01031099.1.p1 GENE.GHVQ01031099.1~~GHVQ01031099.1.p1  ORF type:complete len:110 (+),score=12.96 GHVQ01031099.1:435-764(+)
MEGYPCQKSNASPPNNRNFVGKAARFHICAAYVDLTVVVYAERFRFSKDIRDVGKGTVPIHNPTPQGSALTVQPVLQIVTAVAVGCREVRTNAESATQQNNVAFRNIYT